MQIKKFEAKTMTEALRKVKQEFGPDAVILSARSVKKEHGVLGRLWTPKVEVTAAKDSIVADNHQEELSTGTYNSSVVRPAYRTSLNAAGQGPSDTVQLRTPVRRPLRKVTVSRPKTEDFDQRAIFEKRLVQSGVDESLLGRLWRAGEDPTELHGRRNDQNPAADFMRGLENLKLANGDLSFGGDRQKIVTLVGCSGAGKTTTLAKIASRQSGFAQRRVAFISLDYYRIAANSELQVYAKILDIPLAVVSNQSALTEALRNFQDCDLILIDTPGFIADHPDYLNVLSILTSSGIPMDFYLVSSAPTREQECLRTINQLDLLPVTGFIFTKLDECHACGHLLNLLLRTKIPVAFATHGNRIPEDIEPMSSERLAQIILKDETVGPAPSEEKRTLEANGGSLGRQAGVYSPRFGFGDPGQGAVEATPESKTDRKPYREETAPPDFGERGRNAAGGPGPSVYYVANKKTDLYHLPMCESAKRIKAANIEYFQTRAAAEQESYQPCRLCVLDASMNQYSMPARYAV